MLSVILFNAIVRAGLLVEFTVKPLNVKLVNDIPAKTSIPPIPMFVP